MNKELQNDAWSVLPKSFKKEIKDIFKNCLKNYIVYEKSSVWNEASACYNKLELLKNIFGEHNLTHK